VEPHHSSSAVTVLSPRFDRRWYLGGFVPAFIFIPRYFERERERQEREGERERETRERRREREKTQGTRRRTRTQGKRASLPPASPLMMMMIH